MSERADPDAAPRSVLLGRDLAPDARALSAVSLADFEAIAGVLVGRPVFWALAAGGQAGVEHALAILREEFEIAMALLGAATSAAITPAHLAD